MSNADIIGIARHRMGTDGKGVTTLVGFYGCPLRCKYCLNPACFNPNTKKEVFTPQGLYDRLKCDDLYFTATGGGVTFGGGEPLLNTAFLEEFKGIVGNRWRLTAETCLSVERDSVKSAISIFDEFFVDIKETDSEIYLAYTGKSNSLALENLRYLISEAGNERVTVRLPLIPNFNTEENRRESEALLRAMGATKFDKFNYVVR